LAVVMMSTPALERFPAIRLGAFVALAALGSAYWLSLLADPPVARACVAIAAVAGGASLLAVIEGADSAGWRRSVLAAAALVAATIAALAAIGLPTSTLGPGGWDRLGAGIDRGLAGLGGDVDFPYAGGERWSRLILLAGLVCLLALAAALTFWPRRVSGSGARIGGLATLIAIYAAAAAIRPGPEPLLAGLGLLLLVAAWLWLPGLGRRAAVITATVVVALGAVALPIAAALEARPWVDYRDWELAAASEPSSFYWDHSYAPLRPRDGTPLLGVRSAERHYWRAAVLDSFNGYSWERSRTDVGQPALELPTAVDRGSPAGAPKRLDPDWLVRTEFTLRGLQSDLAVAPGALISAEGIDLDRTPNGTVLVDDAPLGEGDVYTAFSYAPNPSADEMRRAPEVYAHALARHTTVGLPHISEGAAAPDRERSIPVPLRGADAGARRERATRRLAGSPYGDVFVLAQRLVAEAPTTYDAVKAIEIHLRSSYDYDENVRPRGLPLRAFLFEERAGYCEQFSGAMALMLRTLGIPARIAAGFSPGSPDGTRRYLVRDLEGHSWVEVYFTGIGWVPFDPTPGVAPAELQVGGTDAASAAGGGPVEGRPRAAVTRERPPAATAGSPETVPLWPFAILAVLLAAGVGLIVARMLRHRSLSAADAADSGTQELAAALERLGWALRARITLSGVEDVLRAARRPAAAAYVAGLRGIRFGVDGRLPSLSERRRMRRELRRFPGWKATIGSYLAVPPGAPRRRPRTILPGGGRTRRRR
jgi:transglutaminase-like putative cysteine protease